MEDPDLVGAVKVTKRSSIYRDRRVLLKSVSPVDVWAEPEHELAIVIFETAPADTSAFQGFLAFSVELQTGTVQDVSLLSLALGDEGWRVSNAEAAA